MSYFAQTKSAVHGDALLLEVLVAKVAEGYQRLLYLNNNNVDDEAIEAMIESTIARFDAARLRMRLTARLQG